MKINKVTNIGNLSRQIIQLAVVTQNRFPKQVILKPGDFIIIKPNNLTSVMRIFQRKKFISIEEIEVDYTDLLYNEVYTSGTIINKKRPKISKIVSSTNKKKVKKELPLSKGEILKYARSVKKYIGEDETLVNEVTKKVSRKKPEKKKPSLNNQKAKQTKKRNKDDTTKI